MLGSLKDKRHDRKAKKAAKTKSQMSEKELQTQKKDAAAEEKWYENKKTSSTTWVVLLVIALIAALVLMRPYISIILLATLMAVLFNGVYSGLRKKFKGSRSKAALVVSIYSVLVFGIPISLIMFLAFDQAMSFVDSLNIDTGALGGFNIDSAAATVVETINSIAADVIGNPNLVNIDQANEFLHKIIPAMVNGLIALVVGVTKSVPSMFMGMIIYFFVFTGLLVNQENIAKRLRELSPLSKKLNDQYVSRSTAMAKAMLKGQLLIAFLQGLAGATSLAIIGLGEYFVFFLLLFTLMCLVPLGSGIILIPLGLIMIPFGYVWQGLFILAVHFIITTNIDNVIRPKVVPKDAWLPASLTIISAMGGVAIFGLIGVVYGPIIMILIMTTFEAYTDMKKQKELESVKA